MELATVNAPTASTPDPFAFPIGQCVDHVGGGMTSIVLGRSRTAMGRELYEVLEAWTGIHRHVLGHALVECEPSPREREVLRMACVGGIPTN